METKNYNDGNNEDICVWYRHLKVFKLTAIRQKKLIAFKVLPPMQDSDWYWLYLTSPFWSYDQNVGLNITLFQTILYQGYGYGYGYGYGKGKG